MAALNKSQQITTRIVNRAFDFDRASLALFKQLKFPSKPPVSVAALTSEWKDPPQVRW